MNRPLITYQRKDREVLERFQATEKCADRTIENLPKYAKQIALECIEICDNANHLTRMLDSDAEFRYEINCTDMDKLPREVDAVIRYYNFQHGVTSV
jgi:hypothetical protein